MFLNSTQLTGLIIGLAAVCVLAFIALFRYSRPGVKKVDPEVCAEVLVSLLKAGLLTGVEWGSEPAYFQENDARPYSVLTGHGWHHWLNTGSPDSGREDEGKIPQEIADALNKVDLVLADLEAVFEKTADKMRGVDTFFVTTGMGKVRPRLPPSSFGHILERKASAEYIAELMLRSA